MDQQQIKAFIEAMAASDLDEMEVSHDGWTLRLVRHGRDGKAGVQAAQRPAVVSPAPARSAAPATSAVTKDAGPHEIFPFHLHIIATKSRASIADRLSSPVAQSASSQAGW